MRTNAVPFSLSLLALLAGCDQLGPQPSLSHAAAMLWCGPADQGYTAIVLADEPITSAEAAFPHVGIGITESPAQLTGRTWSVTSDSAAARYFTAPNKSERAISGSVTVTSVDSANTVAGSVLLRFPSRIVETQFTAPWIESLMLCG